VKFEISVRVSYWDGQFW